MDDDDWDDDWTPDDNYYDDDDDDDDDWTPAPTNEPTSKPSSVPSSSPTICGLVPVEPYSSFTSYDTGDVVRIGTKRFKCKGYPFSLWCRNVAYAPSLRNGIWRDAWKEDGYCPN